MNVAPLRASYAVGSFCGRKELLEHVLEELKADQGKLPEGIQVIHLGNFIGENGELTEELSHLRELNGPFWVQLQGRNELAHGVTGPRATALGGSYYSPEGLTLETWDALGKPPTAVAAAVALQQLDETLLFPETCKNFVEPWLLSGEIGFSQLFGGNVAPSTEPPIVDQVTTQGPSGETVKFSFSPYVFSWVAPGMALRTIARH